MEQGVQQYLEAQVMTATPQKLRLMLIEGAIRFARQTVELWDQNQNEKALDAIIRSRNIISELISSIRQDESDLTRKVAGVYVFLFRTLTEAQLRRDRELIFSALEVLEIERETWQLVCAKLPGRPIEMEQSVFGRETSQQIVAPAHGIGGPPSSEFILDA